MIHRESAAEYHARKAVSTTFCCELLRECPAQAWFNSCFNPDAPDPEPRSDLDYGTIVHFATLEEHKLAEEVVIIDAPHFRTKAAQELRDQARAEGKVPLLFETARARNSTLYGYEDVRAIHKALMESSAAPLLFGSDGENEVSFTWTWDHAERWSFACKARADRIIPGKIIDLKTAASASPDAFQRAMARDGHHLRAAWYLDGWREGGDWRLDDPERDLEYLFVVVAKAEPHLVQTYRLDERALEWGRRLYRKALSEIRRCRETGVWSGYGGQDRNAIITASLPTSVEYKLADMEEAGEL